MLMSYILKNLFHYIVFLLNKFHDLISNALNYKIIEITESAYSGNIVLDQHI